MKRIFSLFLIGCILAFSLSPVASAAEVSDEDFFFDVLSYSTPNDSGSMVCFATNNKVVASFSTPDGRYIRYVDIIFQVAGGDSFTNISIATSATATQKALTVVDLGNGRYRAYGQYSQYSPSLTVTITGAPLRAVTFDAFRISYQSFTVYDETGTCDISASGYSNTINYVPTDLINYRNFLGASPPELNSLVTWTTMPNWRKYDYIDFTFSFDVSAINSIRVTIGDAIVPADVSYLSSDGVNGHFWFSVRVDLTNVKRTSLDELMVTVSGKVNSGGSNFISVDGMRGYISAGRVNILYVYLREIITEIASVKDALLGDSSSGNQFKNNTSGKIQDLEHISHTMEQVEKPDLNSFDLDLSYEFADASVLMGNIFNVFLGEEWVFRLLLSGVFISLIAFVLYGKG